MDSESALAAYLIAKSVIRIDERRLLCSPLICLRDRNHDDQVLCKLLDLRFGHWIFVKHEDSMPTCVSREVLASDQYGIACQLVLAFAPRSCTIHSCCKLTRCDWIHLRISHTIKQTGFRAACTVCIRQRLPWHRLLPHVFCACALLVNLAMCTLHTQ